MTDILWVLLVLIVVVVAGYRFFSLRRAKTTTPDLYSKLLRRARGDHALAERLIELERNRHPTASRTRLIRYAIERWERDNR